MELILLRHGATQGNLLHQYIGLTDQPLAPQGITQANLRQGQLLLPELLVVSPLLRCRQTAQLVWPSCGQIVEPGLRETDFGVFEGKTWEELKDCPEYRAWIDGLGECPGGESRESVGQRIASAWADVFRLAQERGVRRCGLVTHGGVIMELMYTHCGGMRYDWQPPLCGGWLVQVAPSDVWNNPQPI